jgi:hypothetical protein
MCGISLCILIQHTKAHFYYYLSDVCMNGKLCIGALQICCFNWKTLSRVLGDEVVFEA